VLVGSISVNAALWSLQDPTLARAALDVESASAVQADEAGTEQCNPDASCGVTGAICRYVYGFSGCANPSCYVHPHTPPPPR